MFRPGTLRTVRLLAAVLAATSLTTAAATCRAQSEVQAAQTVEAERAIRAALERRMSFDFTDTPLKDVAAALQRTLGVPIALDSKVLSDAGITGDTTITFVEPAISARMALDTILAEKDLSWIVQRDLLIITTADVAKTRTLIRVYAVADLVLIETTDAYDADFDSLIEVITSTVVPQSWDSNGGAGSIAPFLPSGALVIDQTREIHEKIESLLARLREVRDQQGLRTALKIVGASADANQGGAFAVEETSGDDPATVRPATAQSRWQIPRIYR
jgi:type II secretory pathway component GspD/PulD (secretin)